jgi:uncharacterized damage-inducible protein DinB
MELTARTAERYLRHAFDQLLAVADRLGDDLVNERPHGEGTNAVAALIVHCCGVVEFWLGHVALGEANTRDREAEFSRTATVAELHDLVAAAMARAVGHLARLEAGEGTDEGGRQFLPGGDTSDASVVLHVVEELFQHLGHAELAADALTRRGGAVELNHTIVHARDAAESASWVAELLGLPAPRTFGPFQVVEAANGVSLDFIGTDEAFDPQHYAFLVTEDEFDEIFGRIRDRGIQHWADPARSRPGEILTGHGRGCYFEDPGGNFLEILTVPYEAR